MAVQKELRESVEAVLLRAVGRPLEEVRRELQRFDISLALVDRVLDDLMERGVLSVEYVPVLVRGSGVPRADLAARVAAREREREVRSLAASPVASEGNTRSVRRGLWHLGREGHLLERTAEKYGQTDAVRCVRCGLAARRKRGQWIGDLIDAKECAS
jgi:hypothetical protein